VLEIVGVFYCVSVRRCNRLFQSGIRDISVDTCKWTRSSEPSLRCTSISVYCKVLSMICTTTTPQPFYGPFSGTTQVSRCQKKASSGLYDDRETDNKKQTHRQFRWVPFHPDQSAIHLHQCPHFYTRCPFCCYPPNLSLLGTGTGICWIA